MTELTASRERCLQRAKAIALFLVVVLRWSPEGIPIFNLLPLAIDAAAAVGSEEQEPSISHPVSLGEFS